MLSNLGFESCNFVLFWVRIDCLKFCWWIFFSSIHACVMFFWWKDWWLLMCDEGSTCCYAWFSILDILKFSGNSWMKIFKIFIMFIATCILPANFTMTFIRLPANFAACSSPLPADYACMCVRVCTKRPCFICARLAIWISLQFNSSLWQLFQMLPIYFLFPPFLHIPYFMHFFNFSLTSKNHNKLNNAPKNMRIFAVHSIFSLVFFDIFFYKLCLVVK